MEALEQIIQSSSQLSQRTQSYHREKNRIGQFYSYLHDNLSGDELKTLENLVKSQDRLIDAENMRFFVNGFKLGMSFAVESLN